MKLALCLIVVAAVLAAAAARGADAPAAPAGEDAKLAAFFRAYLDAEFRRHPYDATRAGDHRYDHLLDDLSPQARAADLQATRDTIADLPKQVDYAKLSRAGQIDFEILRHNLNFKLWRAEHEKPYETDPRLWTEYL